MSQLDPAIVRQFGWLDELSGEEAARDSGLMERILASYWDDPGYVPPRVASREITIDGPLGPSTLRLRLYTPEPQAAPVPALVWMHGGGFAAGTIDALEGDGVAREVCQRGGVIVIQVDYHLVTDHLKYPILHHEVIAGFRWTVANANALAIEPTAISLGGASAGGNLALAATFELRDRAERLPDSLVLVYPGTDNIAPAVAGGPDLSVVPRAVRVPPEILRSVFDNYRGAAADAPYLTVGRNDLHGLPPCLIVSGEFDDLRGSGETFAQQATEAGVKVQTHLALGVPHGFMNMTPRIQATDVALTVVSDYVARGPR